jgi:phosphoribosyl 1,2-cyclic phosphodiesterase
VRWCCAGKKTQSNTHPVPDWIAGISMKLTFLGTRGNIDVRNRRHQRHTSTVVSFRRARVMVDCGADWLRLVHRVRPTAIVLTHAHPDHVDGLRQGAPCAVYATREVWDQIQNWPLFARTILRSHEPVTIGSLIFEAVPVEHSIRAPAVGYRISRGTLVVFYVPDVLDITDHGRALADVSLYVGDGATLHRPIRRRQDGRYAGHSSIATQLDWCADTGVTRAIFTHCGTGIVAQSREAEETVAALGRARGIDAQVAHDGLEVTID